ncbi:DUF3237 domain-containing protein [Chitinophaga sp. Mgbs1]|uniref:UPF0311 protein ECE50_012325 n=1 Tax=Chitinophaga solisilvae TaxID=1233460 RepID=A0A9Q5D432_9BACT|nr:DUF3237 domain-containing protein [Chitinophaga solisilvae]
MKKFFFVTFVSAVCFLQRGSAQELKSEFLLDLEIDLNPAQQVGQVLKGTRTIYPFKGGAVKGDKINGKILESGADWGLVLDSNTFKIDVRATVKTDDDALIYVTYSGFKHSNGKSTAPADDYFRTAVSFETNAPKYAWLNHTVAVGVGRLPGPGKVAYRIYAIK